MMNVQVVPLGESKSRDGSPSKDPVLHRQSQRELDLGVQVSPVGVLPMVQTEEARLGQEDLLRSENEELRAQVEELQATLDKARGDAEASMQKLAMCEAILAAERAERDAKEIQGETVSKGVSDALGAVFMESSGRLHERQDREQEIENARLEARAAAEEETRAAQEEAESAKVETRAKGEEIRVLLRQEEASRQDLAVRDEEIEKLRQELASASRRELEEQEIAKLREVQGQVLASRDAEIQKLREIRGQELRDRDEEIVKLRNDVELAGRERARSSHVVEEQKALVTALRQDLAQATQREAQLRGSGPVASTAIKIPENPSEARQYIMARAQLRQVGGHDDDDEEEDGEGCVIS